MFNALLKNSEKCSNSIHLIFFMGPSTSGDHADPHRKHQLPSMAPPQMECWYPRRKASVRQCIDTNAMGIAPIYIAPKASGKAAVQGIGCGIGTNRLLLSESHCGLMNKAYHQWHGTQWLISAHTSWRYDEPPSLSPGYTAARYYQLNISKISTRIHELFQKNSLYKWAKKIS